MINTNGIDYTISKQYWKVGACSDSEFKYVHVFPRSYLANGDRDKNCPYTSIGFNVPKFKALDEKFLYGCLMTSHKDFFNAIPDEEVTYSAEELAHFKLLKIEVINNEEMTEEEKQSKITTINNADSFAVLNAII